MHTDSSVMIFQIKPSRLNPSMFLPSFHVLKLYSLRSCSGQEVTNISLLYRACLDIKDQERRL